MATFLSIQKNKNRTFWLDPMDKTSFRYHFLTNLADVSTSHQEKVFAYRQQLHEQYPDLFSAPPEFMKDSWGHKITLKENIPFVEHLKDLQRSLGILEPETPKPLGFFERFNEQNVRNTHQQARNYVEMLDTRVQAQAENLQTKLLTVVENQEKKVTQRLQGVLDSCARWIKL